MDGRPGHPVEDAREAAQEAGGRHPQGARRRPRAAQEARQADPQDARAHAASGRAPRAAGAEGCGADRPRPARRHGGGGGRLPRVHTQAEVKVAERRRLTAVARGAAPADLYVRGGTLLNVYTGELYPANVAVHGERVAYVGARDDMVGARTTVLDAGGRVLVPGYVDPHVHPAHVITPSALARHVLALGTTTLFADTLQFWELGGVRAFTAVADALARSPVKFYWMIRPHAQRRPTDEARRSPRRALARALATPSAVAAGGVTRWPEVHAGDPGLLARLDLALARGQRVEGHTAGASVERLAAIAARGLSSDHEPITAREVLDRARLGIAGMLRESSPRPDPSDLLDALKEAPGLAARAMLTADGALAGASRRLPAPRPRDVSRPEAGERGDHEGRGARAAAGRSARRPRRSPRPLGGAGSRGGLCRPSGRPGEHDLHRLQHPDARAPPGVDGAGGQPVARGPRRRGAGGRRRRGLGAAAAARRHHDARRGAGGRAPRARAVPAPHRARLLVPRTLLHDAVPVRRLSAGRAPDPARRLGRQSCPRAAAVPPTVDGRASRAGPSGGASGEMIEKCRPRWQCEPMAVRAEPVPPARRAVT